MLPPSAEGYESGWQEGFGSGQDRARIVPSSSTTSFCVNAVKHRRRLRAAGGGELSRGATRRLIVGIGQSDPQFETLADLSFAFLQSKGPA